VQLLAADAASGTSNVAPAQARSVLATKEQISPAPVRIRVDEHCPPSASHRRNGEGSGECACTRSPTPAKYGDRKPQLGGLVDRLGKSGDEPRLGVRQQRDVLGADTNRPFPDVAVVEISPHEHDTNPAPNRRAAERDRYVVADEYEGCFRPPEPGASGIVRDIDVDTGHRTEPQDVVEQVWIGGH